MEKTNFKYARNKSLLTLSIPLFFMIYIIIKNSKYPLIFSNKVFHVLFYTAPDSDQTLYNIAISYIAAYLFYFMQIYYPDMCKHNYAKEKLSFLINNNICNLKEFLFLAQKTVLSEQLPSPTKKYYYTKEKLDFPSNTPIRNYSIYSYTTDFYTFTNQLKKDYTQLITNTYFKDLDSNVVSLFYSLNLELLTNQLAFSNEHPLNKHIDTTYIEKIIFTLENSYHFKADISFELTQKPEDIIITEIEKIEVSNLCTSATYKPIIYHTPNEER